ncbi:Tetraketide alpha-pyrone reductase 1 [Vitis vinifera]|uniref:Tetraketide alpha-pyrone reductase 1 n=1 Tax=Vitis vinifera TaxID=29760 RepID=A0A438IQ94_VITVI|nr:Tetraketide alpha-pyrone reductase 1 [Vitis vinifera]
MGFKNLEAATLPNKCITAIPCLDGFIEEVPKTQRGSGKTPFLFLISLLGKNRSSRKGCKGIKVIQWAEPPFPIQPDASCKVSGYIASRLVKLQLQRGYTVNVQFHNPDDPTKTERLPALDGAKKKRLHLFKADFLEERSFDSMVDGCEGVFHTASPFCHTVSNPQVELIDPAVKEPSMFSDHVQKVPSIKKICRNIFYGSCCFHQKNVNS